MHHQYNEEIDLANFLLGRAYEVTSKIGKLSNLDIDVEDCVDILLATKKCPRISLHLNYLFPYLVRRGWILFDDSLLEYDYVEQKVLYSDHKKSKQLIFCFPYISCECLMYIYSSKRIPQN